MLTFLLIFIGGESQIGMQKGDKFKLFGASVEGENLEIVSEENWILLTY